MAVQVMCPVHRGPHGTRHVNNTLQRLLNPRARGRHPASSTAADGGSGGVLDDGDDASAGGDDAVLLPGDRVLQVRNAYDLGVVNGSIGVCDASAFSAPGYPGSEVGTRGC